VSRTARLHLGRKRAFSFCTIGHQLDGTAREWRLRRLMLCAVSPRRSSMPCRPVDRCHGGFLIETALWHSYWILGIAWPDSDLTLSNSIRSSYSETLVNAGAAGADPVQSEPIQSEPSKSGNFSTGKTQAGT
jgi:hypothetical protein